jgi:hypothetical protein
LRIEKLSLDFDNSKLQTAMRHSENGGLETDRRLLDYLNYHLALLENRIDLDRDQDGIPTLRNYPGAIKEGQRLSLDQWWYYRKCHLTQAIGEGN